MRLHPMPFLPWPSNLVPGRALRCCPPPPPCSMGWGPQLICGKIGPGRKRRGVGRSFGIPTPLWVVPLGTAEWEPPLGRSTPGPGLRPTIGSGFFWESLARLLVKLPIPTPLHSPSGFDVGRVYGVQEGGMSPHLEEGPDPPPARGIRNNPGGAPLSPPPNPLLASIFPC